MSDEGGIKRKWVVWMVSGVIFLAAIALYCGGAKAADDPCATPAVTVAEQVKAEMAADCAKAKEKAAAKAKKQADKATTVWPAGEWGIPITFGYMENPFIGVGGEYRFAQNGLRVSLQGLAGRIDDLDLEVDCGCCGTVPYHEGSRTEYGAAVTLTIPLK